VCNRCWCGIVAESTRAGRSEEALEDPGPGADCVFTSPQRKVFTGLNATMRVITHIDPVARGRPRGSSGGPTGS
jgi:hypothetical protein